MPYIIAKDVKNKGIFKWQVGKVLVSRLEEPLPSDFKFKPGKYKIIIRSSDYKESDESDKFFNISY